MSNLEAKGIVNDYKQSELFSVSFRLRRKHAKSALRKDYRVGYLTRFGGRIVSPFLDVLHQTEARGSLTMESEKFSVFQVPQDTILSLNPRYATCSSCGKE